MFLTTIGKVALYPFLGFMEGNHEGAQQSFGIRSWFVYRVRFVVLRVPVAESLCTPSLCDCRCSSPFCKKAEQRIGVDLNVVTKWSTLLKARPQGTAAAYIFFLQLWMVERT